MREAPSRELIAELLSRGARIAAYDPVAQEEARRVIALDLADHPSWLERLSFVDDEAQAARDADALVIVTEWKIFKRLRRARPLVEIAGDLRRPQPVRAGDDERAGHRIPPDRPAGLAPTVAARVPGTAPASA